MARDKSRPASYADIEALPSNMVGQIIYGVLHAHPRPVPRHSRAAGRTLSELDGPFDRGRDGPGGWIILAEPELHLGPHVVVPDIAGWRVDRLTPFPTTASIETPPDWICEVLSPSTQAIDRTDKLAVYAEFGVKHCWSIDPLARTLEVPALTAEKKWLFAATFKDDDAVAAPPFEVHTFGLDVLWVPEGAAGAG